MGHRSSSRLRFAATFLVAATALAVLAGPSLAGDRQRPGPAIPFEVDRAKLRGDHVLLKLNDDASMIPAHRIKGLPVVDGKIGDRAKLDGGLLVYFPYGRIITAETEFQPYRVDPAAPSGYTPNPTYRQVTSFDRVLGPVCASTNAADGLGGEIDMRIGAQHTISLVRIDPVVVGPTVSIGQKQYRVISAMNIHSLASEPSAAALYATCLSGKSAPRVARK